MRRAFRWKAEWICKARAGREAISIDAPHTFPKTDNGDKTTSIGLGTLARIGHLYPSEGLCDFEVQLMAPEGVQLVTTRLPFRDTSVESDTKIGFGASCTLNGGGCPA